MRVHEIDEHSCNSDCSDFSDGEEQISTENPTQSEPGKREQSMPGTLRGNNTCLNNNRLQASQTANVNVNKTTVIHDQTVFTNVKIAQINLALILTDNLTEEAEIVHINKKIC